MATMFLSNQDEMSKFYRGFSVDDSCTNDLRRRFLEIDQPETRIAYGGYVCKWIAVK